ncbi:MAG: CopG family transcriptional regulator [Robiginitomaculum sp.]|nr:MAG: CopG family transcriptional regulator [Robiginitomaculum sp.]
MKHFIAVVHKEPDSAFGVHFPDVPGCFSAADTFDDVLKNAVDALQLYFEDAEGDTPSPSPFEEVTSQAAEDIAEGAFLLAVPLIQADTKVVRANISMERGMLDAIDAEAKTRGISRSAFLADASRREIEGRH